MPAKGKTRVTDEQRRKIAGAKVAGETAKQIAKTTGLSVRTVERQATDPRTATFILQQRKRSEAELQQGWDLAVQSLLAHLRSKDPDLVIAARRDLLKFAIAGDPPLLRVSPEDSDRGDFTLEELLISYRRATRTVEPVKN